jgi:hypothetical protein
LKSALGARLDGFQTVCVSGRRPFRGSFAATASAGLNPSLRG